MKALAQDAELFLFDFDGTFYRFTEAFERHCIEATARAAQRLGVSLPFSELITLGQESHIKHGTSFAVFRDRFGLKIEDWHEVYHQELEPHLIESSQVTAAHLAACPVPWALLSHSNRYWIFKMLRKFGLDAVTPEDRVFALEDVRYHYKMTSDSPYRQVLDRLGARADRTVMVEDSVRNLSTAKKLGMTTVYVTQGYSFDPVQHPEVDLYFDDVPTMLERLKAARATG